MRQITFQDKYTVKMHKLVWSEQEQALAACYGFTFDVVNSETICTCNIKQTDIIALHNFINLSFQALVQSHLRVNEKAQIFGQIEKMYKEMNAAREVICKERLPYWDTLYAHQKESILLGMGRRHNLFAFEQRLGKSITSASLSRVLQLKRTLVVCISVAKWGWKEDLCDKFGYNPLYFSLLDSKKSKTIKAISPFHERYVIIHYEAMPKHMDYLLAAPFDHIIIDECQMMKNHTSRRYKSIEEVVEANPMVKEVAKFNPGIKISYLSGTPIKNRVDDLFAYFKLCKHPLGQNFSKFKRDYAETGIGRNIEKVTGAKNIDALTLNMANFMIRKTEEQCFDMPPIAYMKTLMELDDYKADYDKVLEELINQKDRSPLSSSIISLNRILAMAKVKGAIELIDNLIENGKKVIVFTSYTAPVDMLYNHYKDGCVVVDGRVEGADRFVRVKRFKTDPDCNLFIGNTTAAGTSINLSEANDTIFLNFTFTSTEISQCIARMKMPNKKKKMGVYFLMCKDTIDEILYDLVADKQDDINQIIDGGQGVSYSGGDIKDLLYKRLMEKTYA